MNKILGILAVLFLALGIGQAQIVCDQQTHIDQNGKYCTVVTTYGGHYDPYNGWTYPEKTEDGQAFPSNDNASVFVEYWADAGLAFDPLKLPGGPLQNNYGDYSTNLISNPSQGVFGASTVYATPPPTKIGQLAYTTTYTVGNMYDSTSEGNDSYQFTWGGTFVLAYRCSAIGRRGCVDTAAEGLLTIEATPGSHP